MTAGKHVLVIENDVTLRELLEFLLIREGYEVTTANDGYTAQRILEAPSTKGIDLIILDLLLPMITGRQLIRWLRGTSREGTSCSAAPLREVPIVVLTDLQDDDDIADALDEGADDYVVKPFQPKELMARLRKLLRIHTAKR